MGFDILHLTAWIQACSAVVTAVVSIILLRQIFFAKDQLKLAKEQLQSGIEQLEIARRQMETSIQWNKLNATFTYFTNDIFMQRERAMVRRFSSLKVNLYRETEPINNEILDAIYNDVDAFMEVKDFLNLLEDYATAVRVGALDRDCSYAIMAAIIIRYARVLMPFIVRARKEMDNQQYYIELEKVALDWGSRFQIEKAEQMKELERVRRKAEEDIRSLEQELKERQGVTEKY